MKVLLFTHEQDIDGMGSIIVGFTAFNDFDYITCNTFEINKKVEEKISNRSIYNYDFIYVTDMCINEPLLTQINNDEELRNKILILDHHKSGIELGNNKYSFVNITVENELGKTSGTSLFYEHLIKNKLLITNSFLDEFVELTRQYDTFEWKMNNNDKARKLHVLYGQVGYKNYIQIMKDKSTNELNVNFSEKEMTLINEFDQTLNEEINNILKSLFVYELVIDSIKYRIGFVKTLYEYRNDLNGVVSMNNINDIDLLGMIIIDKNSVSYRQVKNVDVSKVAAFFGGNGHKEAASSLKDNEKFKKVLMVLN